MSLTRVLRVHQEVTVVMAPGRAPVKEAVTAMADPAVTGVEEAAVSCLTLFLFTLSIFGKDNIPLLHC